MANSDSSILRSRLTESQRASLERRLRGKSTSHINKPIISRRLKQEDTPASFAQQRLWFIDQLEPGKSFYNVPIPLSLSGHLDCAALEKSIAEIIRRHEILRTTFEVKDGIPIQKINPPGPVNIKVTDLRHEPEESRRSLAKNLITEFSKLPFELSKGPLLRTALIRIDQDEYILLVVIHHIASDGWSVNIFVQELCKLYTAFIEGKPSPLEELPIQYADFSEWQRELLSGETLEQHLNYWKTQLSGLPPVLELPLNRPRPARQGFKGESITRVLPGEMAVNLKTLSKDEHATLFMVLLAAFHVLLYRYTGHEDIAIGTPIANRNYLDIENLIGFFINTLVMRADLSGQPTFLDVVKREREVSFEAYAHQDLPFEKLIKELQPDRNLSHSPFFQVMFALQNTPAGAMNLPGLTVNSLEVETNTAKFDITLTVIEEEERLRASWNYNTDILDESTISRMATNFETLLRGVVSDPNQKISQVPILSEGEQRQLIVDWNATEKEYPRHERLHTLFEAQAARIPGEVALVFEGQAVTYRELNARANQLARHLQSIGVGPEVIVTICVKRSVEMVVGLIGVLKAGGAYMPLDPLSPRERLATIMEDVNSPVLLTQRSLLDNMPAGDRQVFCLDSDWEDIAKQSASNLSVKVEMDNIRVVIQTSGTTGKPKGIMVPERGLLNVCLWYQGLGPFNERSSALLLTAFSFDGAFKNIITPLISGSKLILANSGYYDASELFQALVANKVTIMFSAPSQFYPILDLASGDDYKSLSSLRCLIMGAEPTIWAKLRPWQNSRYCDCRLVHTYGPAECSITTSTYEVSKEKLNSSDNIPIGEPVNNSNFYVMDQELNLLPVGIPGELCIGGVCVTRGYLDKPDLTAASFIPNPFRPDERIYKSGDLVRWTEDGNLEFLGRIDHQVKIRGQRLELDEIRTVINQYPGVRENLVIAKDYEPGDKRLIAYVIPDKETGADIGELRSFLRRKLPQYMVPHYIMHIDSLPVQTNGKVNRRMLPDPDWSKSDAPDAYAAPTNPVEETLASIWGEVLGIKNIGIHDDFFQRGGHSLLATQLISRVSQAFKVSIPLRTIFEKKNIADMAVYIEEEIIREIAGVE